MASPDRNIIERVSCSQLKGSHRLLRRPMELTKDRSGQPGSDLIFFTVGSSQLLGKPGTIGPWKPTENG